MAKTLPAQRSEYTALLKRFPAYAGLAKGLFTEARLTKTQKLTLGAGLGYLASPVDLIPGVIPVVGQLDDILVLLMCIRKVLRDFDAQKSEELLTARGLTHQQIDSDIALVGDTLKAVAKKTASVAWGGLSRVGKAALAVIKPRD